jgi:hypothetical protein
MPSTQESITGSYAPYGSHDTLTPQVSVLTAEPIAPYWTWKRLTMFVVILRNGRIPTPGEWQVLRREIPSLSEAKRIWLYQQLSSFYSREALKYLFDEWRPPSIPVDLDLWLSPACL